MQTGRGTLLTTVARENEKRGIFGVRYIPYIQQ